MGAHEKIRLIRELNKWSQEGGREAGNVGRRYAKIERGETQLNIPRLEQIAKIFNISMWDLLQSGKGGLVFQLNEGDSGGDISFYKASNASAEVEMLKLELKHCQELLLQKDKEIELLRKVANMMD